MYSLHIFILMWNHGLLAMASFLMTGNCSIQALIFCFPPFFREHTTNEKIFENRLSDIEFNIPLKKFSITNQGHISADICFRLQKTNKQGIGKLSF